jgi:hypothetical protein
MRFAQKAGGIAVTLGLALGLSAMPATPAYAAPIACDVTALVDAIDDANTAGGGIVDLAPNCVYTLVTDHNDSGNGPNGLPLITEDITLNGSNSVIERSTAALTPKFRILEVGDPDGELTLNRLTLRNGDPGAGFDGGAVHVCTGRDLEVNSSTLTDNHAQDGGAFSSDGTATVVGSTLSDNSAADGGRGPSGLHL